MNAIAALLERAKVAYAPRVEIPLTRRVRPWDLSCSGGYIVEVVDGWVFWIGDDGLDHLSRPDFIEEI